MSEQFDLLVIGAGVAGLTLAEQAVRRGLTVALAEESMFGGLVMNVNHLQPGLDGLPSSGSDLAAELMTRASDLGVTTVFEPVTGLDGSRPDDLLEVVTASGTHAARAVAIASGARLRRLGVPGEAEFEHRGVSHCADCDGPLYRGEPVMVVGGGDSALQEALVLAEFCSVVHLVHRGAQFSARPEFVAAVSKLPERIAVRLRTVVESLAGDGGLSSVQVRDLDSGQTHTLPCKGFFAYVGLEPNTAFLPASIEKRDGRIQVNDRLETSVANVYAVGAVRAGFAGELQHAIADAQLALTAICARAGRA